MVEDKRMLGLIWDITDEGEVEFFCQGQFQKSLPEVECAVGVQDAFPSFPRRNTSPKAGFTSSAT